MRKPIKNRKSGYNSYFSLLALNFMFQRPDNSYHHQLMNLVIKGSCTIFPNILYNDKSLFVIINCTYFLGSCFELKYKCSENATCVGKCVLITN